MQRKKQMWVQMSYFSVKHNDNVISGNVLVFICYFIQSCAHGSLKKREATCKSCAVTV